MKELNQIEIKKILSVLLALIMVVSTIVLAFAFWYEFDCGELSGWMYRVNGWFPNYGALVINYKQGIRSNGDIPVI